MNRLTDDQSQARVRSEAEAVEGILRLVCEGRVAWVSSTALEIEISRNPDADRRHDVAALLAFSNEVVVPRPRSAERAAFLQKLGFGVFDALHLASAELGRADVFLTTDDGLLRRAARYNNELRIRVREPGILVSGSGTMSLLEKMSDEDFERHALAILKRELGLDGLARFLRLYRSGSGDYTRDRHRWLEGVTIQEIMAEVERRDKPAA